MICRYSHLSYFFAVKMFFGIRRKENAEAAAHECFRAGCFFKVIPLGFRVMECFLEAGFMNREIIIKEQYHCHSTKYWEIQEKNFLLLAHEYIFVFQK